MKPGPVIFAATLLLYMLSAGGHLYSPDEEVLFRTTRALASGRAPAIQPLHGFATRPATPPRPDGLEYAQYGLGQPLLAVPFYWAGAALARLGSDELWMRLYGADSLQARLAFDPVAEQLAPRWACSWFNVLVGALLAWLVFALARELTHNSRAATWTALLFAFATIAWPHSRPFFTESLAALCLGLALFALLKALRAQRMLPWLALAGLAAGYAALVRNDSILFFPGLGLLVAGPVALEARARRRSIGAAWSTFAIPPLLCGMLILALNLHHFGGPFQTGYADQAEGVAFSTPLAAGLYGFLFSVGKGIFFFSPALVFGLLGWKRLATGQAPYPRTTTAALALMIALFVLVMAKWQNWAGGWCWGPRHIVQIHPFLMLPAAAWLAAGNLFRVRRALALALLVVGIAVQLLGVSQDFITFYHRFYRTPPSQDRHPAIVMLDPMDRQFWSRFYQVRFRPHPDRDFRPVQLHLPAPTQHSLFVPRCSVWSGYLQMLREGSFDNFWVRLASNRERTGS